MKKFFCPPCLIGLVLVLVVLGGYYLLRGGYQTPQEEIAPAPEGEVIPEEVAEIKEITVSGTEYSFSPSSIMVSVGERVKITFKNDGRAPHNLIVEGLGISTKTIGGGQTDTIEFTAPSSGTYTFICLVPGHRAAGMEGSLIVE